MPLIDLKSNLKDLPYGPDRKHGGQSRQPYITSPIPDGDFANFDEGLIRGGIIGAGRAAFNDTLRIGKFMIDLPKGPLFIVKQVGLQLSNPRLESKPLVTLPGSSLLSRVINSGIRMLSDIGQTRIYNLGINTLAQVPLNALGGHIVRHGFTPIHNEDTNYFNVAKKKTTEENRLVGLYNKLVFATKKKDVASLRPTILSLVGQISSINFSNIVDLVNREGVIDEYIGGPGSALGIGTTVIKRTEYTPVVYEKSKYIESLGNTLDEKIEKDPILKQVSDAKVYPSGSTSINIKFGDTYTETSKYLTENRINTGRPGRKKNQKGANGKIDYTLVDSGSIDKVTAYPIFRDSSPKAKEHEIRDLIKFRFEAIVNDDPNLSDFIVFRAFLTNINDNYNAQWNPIKYTGRGEQFYTYDSFNRSFAFNFQVPAQSRAEMRPMYQKLNYLASNLAPDYNQNVMRAPLMKLTIGNYIYRLPGFITSLNYNIDPETPWEIAVNEPEKGGDADMLELPQMINVVCQFTPIHNFLPRKSHDKSPFIAVKGEEGSEEGQWIRNTKIQGLK